jgi:hypothetical protein
MQKRMNTIASATTGLPIQGASVQVNVGATGSGGAATIYSDNGVTVTANPLTTDANGQYSYYAANNHYQEVISGTNITTLTINDVILLDMLPADLSTTLPSTAGQPWNNGGVISVS